MQRSLCLAVVLLLIGDARAGHYKYSTLHWERQSGSTVLFTLRSAWSTEFQPYNDQVAGGVIRAGQEIRVQGLGDPVLYFGDGPESFQIVKATVTSVDHTLKTWVGEARVLHTYATPVTSSGQAWVATFGGCCRDSDVKNRNAGYFNVSTSVLLNTTGPSYSPIIASLPRQMMLGGVGNPSNGFMVAAYDHGKHPSSAPAGPRYRWEIKSQESPMLPLSIDSNTGQVWGLLNSCPTQAPSTACLYAMRVAVMDRVSGAMSEVDFEIEVLPAAVSDAVPRLMNESAGAPLPLPLPLVNHVYSSYAYMWRLLFDGRGLPLAGVQASVLPQGALLGPTLRGPGDRFDTNLTWHVPLEAAWRVVCLQTYSNGSQAYRDKLNHSLPIRSRQVCVDWSVRVDPAPEWLEPANMSSVVTTVYMGEHKTFDLIAADENARDTLALTARNVPDGGVLADRLPTGGGKDRVNQTFTFSPPEKSGGLEGEVCFDVADTLKGVGGGGSDEVCLKYRVPKCLYRVSAGQTLLDIAAQYGVNWLQLWALNKNISRPEGYGLEGGIKAGDVVHVGQLVLVRQGDSLERLAARFGTTLRQIIALNRDITPTRPLIAGQLVCLVPSTCMDKAPASAKFAAGPGLSLYYA